MARGTDARGSSALALWGYAIGGALLAAVILVGGWLVFADSEDRATDPQEQATTLAENTSAPPSTDTSGAKSSPATSDSAAQTAGGKAESNAPAAQEPEFCSMEWVHAQGFFTKPSHVVDYCDGNWLRLRDTSPEQRHMNFWWRTDQQQWREIEGNGRLPDGRVCYYPAFLEQLGVPEAIRPHLPRCSELSSAQAAPANPGRQPASSALRSVQEMPACDGRYILIVESVLQNENQRLEPLLEAALARHPGATFTEPGRCSSLRVYDNGSVIYPIYYPFGNDIQALCSAKARLGGNARSLNENADFTDPCG
ncbi:hypothetical protein ACFPVT_03925 [Corynebacterium choanae]|uniref:Uncharacterized protein n=1 Tax=Corynebacterium choanae TaxID=1862358 RepID=A0A3G6J8A7_9CORY|nr:hypothetical protein [Corynebacterium choanae]AZA14335.1 hypothetical protein CCHOA_09760 [Corynebacterium choanae]